MQHFPVSSFSTEMAPPLIEERLQTFRGGSLMFQEVGSLVSNFRAMGRDQAFLPRCGDLIEGRGRPVDPVRRNYSRVAKHFVVAQVRGQNDEKKSLISRYLSQHAAATVRSRLFAALNRPSLACCSSVNFLYRTFRVPTTPNTSAHAGELRVLSRVAKSRQWKAARVPRTFAPATRVA